MKKSAFVIVLITLVVFSIQAEEETQEKSVDFSLAAVKPLMNTTLVGFPLPTGALLGVEYTGISVPWSNDPIRISLAALCGYPTWSWYRNPDGSPLSGVYTREQVAFDYFTIGWQAGILVPFPLREDSLLLGSFLFVKGWYNAYVLDGQNLIYSSSLPDKEVLLSNSFLAGFVLTDITVSDEQLIKGITAELSAEWHPDWAGDESLGDPEFLRLDFQTRAYMTLIGNTPAGGLYLAEQFYADYLAGDSIPFFESSLVGGTSTRSGLGGLVRGYEGGAYDTRLKIANNLEFRWVFPGLIYISENVPLFRPVISVFADAGYYDDYFADPSAAPGGFLFSAGFGAHIKMFNAISPGIYMAFPIAGEAVNQEPFALSIVFSLHY